jgi:DNA polymerase
MLASTTFYPPHLAQTQRPVTIWYMDSFSALRLQLEWGADEALLEQPQNRLNAKPVPSVAPPKPRPAAAPAAALPAGPADAARIAAACNTLEDLRAALNNFTGCALRDTATRLVFADGAEQTNLMLIGEAPGAEEDRAGLPFVGPAGQLLDKMLASINFNRTDLRIVNVVPWRPPGNRTPAESEIAVCLPFLHRHIALIRPKFLLLLGGVAAKAMLQPEHRATGIRRLRGQWHDLQIHGLDAAIPTLPTFHPAYLLRTASAKRESWHDLIALRQRLTELK